MSRAQVDCPKIVKAFSKVLVNEYNNGPLRYTDQSFLIRSLYIQ
jgi:hypothetical protein